MLLLRKSVQRDAVCAANAAAKLLNIRRCRIQRFLALALYGLQQLRRGCLERFVAALVNYLPAVVQQAVCLVVRRGSAVQLLGYERTVRLDLG